MTFYLLLFLVCGLVCADFDPCEYVSSHFILENVSAVRDCFNTHVFSTNKNFTSSLLQQIEWALELYPYVDIAKNPPSHPSQEYYGKVNATEALNNLRNSLENSGNVVSKVFRPLKKFFASFRDGHFDYQRISNSAYANDVFFQVGYAVPFSWNYLPDSNGVFHVYIPGIDSNAYLKEIDQNHLDQLVSGGIYVESIDGKDAFEYLSNFFGDKMNRRSLQGRLHQTRRYSILGPYILDDPPEDDIFSQHVLKLSNGEEYPFNIRFVNQRNRNSKETLPLLTEKSMHDITFDREIEILESLRSYQPKFVKDIKDNKYVYCINLTGVNYMSIHSFSADSTVFLDELFTCVKVFDENDHPIVLDLPGNGGGSISLAVYTFGLLSPYADYTFPFAVRRTDKMKDIAHEGGFGEKVYLYSEKCAAQNMKGKSLNSFWNSEEIDDYGNGVLHNRTKLFYIPYFSQSEKNKYSLTKHVRKPTDIIVITDGLCFSACSMLVNQFIETGSAIIAGVGFTNPGDEMFVASQCPSSVVSLHDVMNCKSQEDDTGLSIRVTITETFSRPEDKKTMIPRDYTISRIDANLGVYPNYTALYQTYDQSSYQAVLTNSYKLHELFKSYCNSANQRVFYVTDNCSSSDPHAKFVGYSCGSDGKWNISSCKISACENGYRVDFINNKCLKNDCDFQKNPSNNNKLIIGVTIGVIIGVFILIIIIVVVLLLLRRNKSNNTNYISAS